MAAYTRAEAPSNGEARSGVHADWRGARYQAFGLLRVAFTVAPTGFDEAGEDARHGQRGRPPSSAHTDHEDWYVAGLEDVAADAAEQQRAQLSAPA